jgi:hypothetical protein
MTTQEKQAGSKEQRLAVEYVILRSGAGFTDGLCSGFISYFHEVAGKPLSDTEIYRTLIDAICVPGYADEFNVGYVTGWIEALIEDRNLFAQPLA